MNLRRAVAQFNALAFAERHGGHKESLSDRNHEYLLPCPRCASSRLRWNASKNGWGAWKCWRCHLSGDTLSLIERLEQVDELAAIDIVMAGHVGGDAPVQLATKLGSAPRARKIDRLPQIPWPRGVDVLAQVPMHARAWLYLRSRGLESVDVPLGFGRQGWLKDYLVFPVYMDGGLVYWQGRATWDPPAELQGEERKRWVADTGYLKSKNPKGVQGYATAEDVLLNYERARTAEHVVICEGPFDAMKVGPHAVALLGKAASPAKVQRLLRCRAMRYTVYLDSGEEERSKAEQLAEQLTTYAPTYIATPPPGYDPGALTVRQNAAVIANAVPFRGRQLRSNLG